MTISHIYSILYPQYGFLYLIGRLAFPLFAWSIANGAIHTKNVKAYVVRLLVLAIISQVPYVVSHRLLDPSFWELNVVFTLLCGLLAVRVLTTSWDTPLKAAAVVFIAAAAETTKMDYGAAGVLSVVSFYLFKNHPWKLLMAQFGVMLIMLGHPAYEIIKSGQIYFNNLLYFGNVFGLLSLILIHFYNGKRGMNLKYTFYIYYPLHFIILFLIRGYLW